MFVRLIVRLPTCGSLDRSVVRSHVRSFALSTYLSIYLSVCVCICLSIHSLINRSLDIIIFFSDLFLKRAFHTGNILIIVIVLSEKRGHYFHFIAMSLGGEFSLICVKSVSI